MMEKICAEMYCSALGSTDVEFYVERGTSDEFIMQKIYDILDLDITYKRECLDGPLFVIRSTETNEYLERCMYFEKTPKWTNQRCCASFFETRTAAMEYLECYLKEEFIEKCQIKKVDD